MRTSFVATLAAAAFVTAAPAFAVPLTTNPGPITANGQSYAVFVFADAADKDQLTLSGFGGTIFDNKVNSTGQTADLGVRSGTQTFMLTNVTTGATFSTGVLDGVDNAYHARYSTDYSSFGVGALSAAATASLARLPSADPVLFVGFEDLRFGDYDYNDLIFAFVTQPRTAVPEPASLALLGCSLVTLGMIRRRRRSS